MLPWSGISFPSFSWMWIPRTSHQIIKYQLNSRTRFFDDRDLQLAKLVLTEKSDTSVSEWLCNEPLLIQSHFSTLWSREERAKLKTVHKVRNKDLLPPFSPEDRNFFFFFGGHFWKKLHYNAIKVDFTLKATLRVLEVSLGLLPMHPKGLRPRKTSKASSPNS